MGQLRVGVHKHLEEEANRLIKESLKGVTKHSEKSDILTPWKQMDRHRREVYSSSGVVDPSIRKGMFKRAANKKNPELNSRDGVTRPRNSGGSLGAFMNEYGYKSQED